MCIVDKIVVMVEYAIKFCFHTRTELRGSTRPAL